MRRGAIVVMLLCTVQLLSSQIRIISQEKLLEASEFNSVEDSPLRFVNDVVSFGTIDEMSGVWQGRAKLRNSGADTIVVTQVKSTCGCLKAESAKRVLAPKEEVVVALKYYPRGHAGRVRQRVLLYTNLSNERPSTVLTLTGMVTAAEDKSFYYPYTRGVLRLRQDTVRLSGEREVQRIAIMNGGSTELKLEVDTHFLPKGVSVRFEPSKIAPKGQGDMVVEYNPTDETTPANLGKIYIKGLNLPPRQSAIEVILKN
ncbi:MAG: DUF1573 domain-containing protein [Alistipes sp.]|nr:DUF1573 domain-containing protein [Alistipes sp.]